MSVTNYQARLYLALESLKAKKAAQASQRAAAMPILQRRAESRAKGQESRQRGLFA